MLAVCADESSASDRKIRVRSVCSSARHASDLPSTARSDEIDCVATIGKCLGCLTQFAIDVRLPLPAVCPDCGADVLARADIKGPFPPGRPPFNALRIRRAKR